MPVRIPFVAASIITTFAALSIHAHGADCTPRVAAALASASVAAPNQLAGLHCGTYSVNNEVWAVGVIISDVTPTTAHII
jgi:hypothetical protein